MNSASSAHAEKRSLAAILRAYGPLPVMDAIDVTLDVCDELANAHMNNVVHGDLGVHRVRTHWPRHPGQPVDIFALGETDTAAFEIRLSAGSILVAPEQKDGRIVDARADIFCVGVMLHWLITGAPPGLAPLHVTLRSAPRPVVATIEACLAPNPAHRPSSIDDVAEALGSFAASPPDRFAQIARRRLAQANAKLVRKDYDELSRALRRLDDAAISREISTATEIPGPQETLVMFSVQSLAAARRRAQTDRYHPVSEARTRVAPPGAVEPASAWGEGVETLPRPSLPDPASGYYPASRAPAALTPEAAAGFLSPDSVVADIDDGLASRLEPAPRARVASVPPLSYDTPLTLQPPKRSVWSSVFGFVATALVVAVLVGGAAHLSARMSNAGGVLPTKGHVAKRGPKTATAAPAAAAPAAPTMSAATPAGGPTTTSAAALPDAPAAPAGPSVNAEPPVLTPASLPNAKPARAPRGSSPRTKASGRSTGSPAAVAPPAREGASPKESAPAADKDKEKDFNPNSVLSDALR